MRKRIPVYEIINRQPVKKILVLKKAGIEVRTVKSMHTKADYTIDPHDLTYTVKRAGRKEFALLRNNPYAWEININHKYIFKIDSEKDIETFMRYIKTKKEKNLK